MNKESESFNESSNFGRLLVLPCVVASTLMAAGYTAEESVNPFDPNHTAWLFQVTPKLAYDAERAYVACNKRVPPFLERIIEQIEQEQYNTAEDGEAD